MTGSFASGGRGSFWLAGEEDPPVAGDLDLSDVWPVVRLEKELLPTAEEVDRY